MADAILTQQQLKALLNYNEKTGIFTWRSKRRGVKQFSVAGTLHHSGYIHILINYKKYLAHRLAWLYVTGEMPVDQLDHINRIRNDNRICNLRACTRAENMRNMSVLKMSDIEGATGVSWHTQRNKFRAYIYENKKQIHLGYFADKNDAIKAHKKAVNKHYSIGVAA